MEKDGKGEGKEGPGAEAPLSSPRGYHVMHVVVEQ